MWKAEHMIFSLIPYASSTLKNGTSSESGSSLYTALDEIDLVAFQRSLERFVTSKECKPVIDEVSHFLKRYIGTHTPNVACDKDIEHLYMKARENAHILKCFQTLPLEWQLVIFAHMHHACAFGRSKDVEDTDVESILPTTLKLAYSLTSIPYWKEMLDLSMEYSFQEKSQLPDVKYLRQTAPRVKGQEALLLSKEYDGMDQSVDRHSLCKMNNLKPVLHTEVPDLLLDVELRVYSDQTIKEDALFPQPALSKLASGSVFQPGSLHWKCGYIWANTYPLWMWDECDFRLDITIPAKTVVKYTPFLETMFFTSLNDTSRHITVMLPPGSIKVQEVFKIPRLQKHFSESANVAFEKKQIVVLKCEYHPETRIEPPNSKRVCSTR